MAYANDVRAVEFNAGFFATLRSSIADRVAKYKIYRATINELEVLSNRELSDLGLSRSMIKGVAIEAAYGAK